MLRKTKRHLIFSYKVIYGNSKETKNEYKFGRYRKCKQCGCRAEIMKSYLIIRVRAIFIRYHCRACGMKKDYLKPGLMWAL